MTTAEFPEWLMPLHPEYYDASQAAWDKPLATEDPLLRAANLRALDAPPFLLRYADLERRIFDRLHEALRARGVSAPEVLAGTAIWGTLIRMRERGLEPVRDPYAYALTTAMKLHIAHVKAIEELRGQTRALVPATVRGSSPPRRLGEFISTLSPRQQQVAVLIGEGQSYASIAVILGIAESTVRVHISSIRKQFRQWEERGGQG